MLDNIDNDLKLLKMVEKLLEISDSNNEANLEKYAKLAKQIDTVKYNNIVEKIKDKSNNHNQSFEEELLFLEEIENEYEQLNELQFKFKNTYERYSLSNLELSNINDINIDAILDRKNLISGYLVNLKNIESNKEKLEKYNEKLILEDKKRISIEKRLVSFEEELKNSFINSEGRVYSKTSGVIQYSSVISEYKENGIDLHRLFDDKELLDKMLNEAYELRKDKEEVLSTAEFCYKNAPTKENMEIFSSIKLDAVKARYRLSLFKMIELVSKIESTYEKAFLKREELSDLIKYRKACLKELGVKFSFDPFNNIKVNEQLGFLSKLTDNSNDISSIRREIISIADTLEELEGKNNDFILGLNREVKFIKNSFLMNNTEIGDNYNIDSFDNIKNIYVKDILPNQVIDVKNVSEKFILTRVLEKTKSVINRVNEMFNGNIDINIQEKVEVAPELVVENVKDDLIDKDIEVIDNDNFNQDEVFVPDVSQTFDEALDELVSKKVDDDLFQDIEPFKTAPLFNDKLDTFDDIETLSFDEIKNNKNDSFELTLSDEVVDSKPLMNESYVLNIDKDQSIGDNILFENIDTEYISDNKELEDELPDAFWVTQDDDDNVVDNVVSFDEQINKLLSNDNDEPKKRMLAA